MTTWPLGSAPAAIGPQKQCPAASVLQATLPRIWRALPTAPPEYAVIWKNEFGVENSSPLTLPPANVIYG